MNSNFEYYKVFYYVANLDAPDCSELGSIGIAPANGGLVRTE